MCYCIVSSIWLYGSNGQLSQNCQHFHIKQSSDKLKFRFNVFFFKGSDWVSEMQTVAWFAFSLCKWRPSLQKTLHFATKRRYSFSLLLLRNCKQCVIYVYTNHRKFKMLIFFASAFKNLNLSDKAVSIPWKKAKKLLVSAMSF